MIHWYHPPSHWIYWNETKLWSRPHDPNTGESYWLNAGVSTYKHISPTEYILAILCYFSTLFGQPNLLFRWQMYDPGCHRDNQTKKRGKFGLMLMSAYLMNWIRSSILHLQDTFQSQVLIACQKQIQSFWPLLLSWKIPL